MGEEEGSEKEDGKNDNGGAKQKKKKEKKNKKKEGGVNALGVSVSSVLLEEGLVRLTSTTKKRWAKRDDGDLIKLLSKAQNKAKTGRVNMWRYGDVGTDDEM